MKVSRDILRRIELKIYHAITAEQMKKSAVSEVQQKQDSHKVGGSGPLLSK